MDNTVTNGVILYLTQILLMKKAVIFDMDGTLVDNIPYHLESWLAFLDKYNIEVDEANFLATNHGTLIETVLKYFGPMSIEEARDLGEEKESMYREMYRPHMKPIEGLTELLENLKSRSIKISLATMGDRNNMDFIIDGLGIKSYFDLEIGGHQVTNGKPHPEVFHLTMEKLGLNPNECLVMEDSGGGIKSATAAGIDVVGVATTLNKDQLYDLGCVKAISNFSEFSPDLLA